MLLRFIVLHGAPKTEEDWAKYRLWKKQQMELPECRMAEVEGVPDGVCCETCPSRSDCPKAARRR